MILVAALWHCCGRHPLYLPSGASLYSVPRCIGPRFPWDSVVHASMRFQSLLHRALDWQAGSTLRIMMARLRHQLDWIHRYLGDTPLVVSIRYFETGLTDKGMCTLMWAVISCGLPSWTERDSVLNWIYRWQWASQHIHLSLLPDIRCEVTSCFIPPQL